MFQQPSQGDKVDVKEIVGSLVLIYVREVREGITTPYGEAEAVAVDLHALDGPKGGEKFENALLFQKALIGSLRNAAGGEPVLGRISQGVAKPGQSPPYILEPFTPADAAIATGYIQRMKPGFQPPAGSQTAAPPSPATAPAAVPAGQMVDISKLPPEVQALLQASAS